MSAADYNILEQLPEAALQIRDGQLVYANSMAKHYLPQLTEGSMLPAELDFPVTQPSCAGTFTLGQSTYSFRMTLTTEGQTLLFRPAPQSALTDLQLEGALAQLRQFLGEFSAELGPYTTGEDKPLSAAAKTGFLKSYHRAFRLINNMDYLRQAGSAEGISFRSSTLDLAGLCRQLCLAAGDLLAETNTSLHLDACPNSLLIPGDAGLLQRLLLGLIANSAKAAKGGSIHLDLRTRGNRAILTLSDSGAPLSPRQMAAMLQQDNDHSIPMPGQGAGLGLAIARHIVALHRGTLLVEWGDCSPIVRVALPLGPLDHRLSVETPRADHSGGLSPLFVELADVLPANLFEQESLD